MKHKFQCRLLITFSLSGLSGCESDRLEISLGNHQQFSTITAYAIEDLSGRISVLPEDITVVREESVTWPDGSLGCPKEGVMYTQAMVAGGLIVLRVDGQSYEYHFSEGRAPFLCDLPQNLARKGSID